MPQIDWGLARTKQVMESDFSQNVKGNQGSIIAGGGSGGRTKGGKSITVSWLKCFPRPSCDADFVMWSAYPRRLHWDIRWEGGKICPLSLDPQYFRGVVMAPMATRREMEHLGHQVMTEGPGSVEESLPLGHTGQVGILPK